MGQSLGHEHLPGDRLIPFCEYHLNVSLAVRRHRANRLITSPLILGVRQYCLGIGVTGGLPHERDRTRSVDWDAVDAADRATPCLAAFSGSGVTVIDGLGRIVRAFLDNILSVEIDVIDATELHGLFLISRETDARVEAEARRRLAEALREVADNEGMGKRSRTPAKPAAPRPRSVKQPTLMASTLYGQPQVFLVPPALKL